MRIHQHDIFVKTLPILALACSFQLYAQNVVKPFVDVGFYQSYLDFVSLSELEVGIGAQFNDYISAQMNLRGSQSQFRDPDKKFKIATISFEPSYRILSKKHMFSPVLAYDAGLEIVHNGRNKFLQTSNFIYLNNYMQPYDQYVKGLYFGKAKLLLNIRYKDFDLLLGPTYNTYFFKINRLKPEGPQDYPASPNNDYKVKETYVDKQFGFGFEASLKYTFPMKKRLAKKQAEQVGE